MPFVLVAAAGAVWLSAPNWRALAERGPAAKAGYAVSPSGSDANPCTSARPCRTFNQAYHVVPAGAVVEVAGGSYGDQLISGVRPGGRPVIFRPAKGADVVVGELRTDPNGAGNFEVNGMSLADAYLAAGTHDVTFRNDTMKLFYLRTTRNVAFIGGRVGGTLLSPNSPTIGAADSAPSRNTLIDGVLFHDIRIDPSVVPAEHGECLFVQEADGLTIRNSTFRDCSDFDIYFHQIGGGGNPRNVVLENNFLGRTTEGGFYTLFFRNDVGEQLTNIRLSFNSSAQGFHFDDNGSISNVDVIGNDYGPTTQCTKGVRYDHNVIQGIRCGPTDVDAKTGFVDPSTGDRGPGQLASGGNDLHLVRGSKAIGFVRAKGAPPYDIDHDARPRSRAVDAGADQHETAAIVLGKSVGRAAIGQSRATLEGFYGRPRRVSSGRGGVRIATYRLHGGLLWVMYAGSDAVGVGTNSGYYSTTGGLAPGSDAGSLGRAGLRPNGCARSYGRRLGTVVVSARLHGSRVSEIAMTRRPYASC